MSGTIRAGKPRSSLPAVFLPYKRMKVHFPIQEKWPLLLPYCWGKRIVRFLRGDVKKYQRMLDYRDVNPKDFEKMKRFFETGGII